MGGSFACRRCGSKRFHTYVERDAHQSTCRVDFRYRCEPCRFRSSFSRNYRRHLTSTAHIRKVSSVSGTGTQIPREIQPEQSGSSTVPSNNCELPNASLTRSPTSFEGQNDGRSFRVEGFGSHMQYPGKMEKRTKFVCRHCGSGKFHTYPDRDAHQLSCKADFRYKCQPCGFGSSFFRNYSRHLNSLAHKRKCTLKSGSHVLSKVLPRRSRSRTVQSGSGGLLDHSEHLDKHSMKTRDVSPTNQQGVTPTMSPGQLSDVTDELQLISDFGECEMVMGTETVGDRTFHIQGANIEETSPLCTVSKTAEGVVMPELHQTESREVECTPESIHEGTGSPKRNTESPCDVDMEHLHEEIRRLNVLLQVNTSPMSEVVESGVITNVQKSPPMPNVADEISSKATVTTVFTPTTVPTPKAIVVAEDEPIIKLTEFSPPLVLTIPESESDNTERELGPNLRCDEESLSRDDNMDDSGDEVATIWETDCLHVIRKRSTPRVDQMQSTFQWCDGSSREGTVSPATKVVKETSRCIQPRQCLVRTYIDRYREFHEVDKTGQDVFTIEVTRTFDTEDRWAIFPPVNSEEVILQRKDQADPSDMGVSFH